MFRNDFEDKNCSRDFPFLIKRSVTFKMILNLSNIVAFSKQFFFIRFKFCCRLHNSCSNLFRVPFTFANESVERTGYRLDARVCVASGGNRL